MEWNIITDSSCDRLRVETTADNVEYACVPFVLQVDGRDFVDDETLDTGEMMDAMEQCGHSSHSACPAPGAWLEQYRRAEKSIAVTISSGVSGSYASAVTARDMALEEDPARKIFVVDSLSAGPALAMIVRKIEAMIGEKLPFDEIAGRAQKYARELRTVFALSSFDNLAKSGRISKLSGFVAGKLGIRAIGIASPEGRIVLKQKTRGAGKLLSLLLEDMKERGYRGGKLIISHCKNLELAERLRCAVLEHWPAAQIAIMPTRGLCSYYAERGGLIASY